MYAWLSKTHDSTSLPALLAHQPSRQYLLAPAALHRGLRPAGSDLDLRLQRAAHWLQPVQARMAAYDLYDYMVLMSHKQLHLLRARLLL